MYALLEKYEGLRKDALYLQETLNMLPFSIYWKNIHGQFLGINNLSLKSMRETNKNIGLQNIIGSYDNQLFDIRSAFRYQRHDQLIIRRNQPKVFRETIYKQKIYSGFAYKLPLLNFNKKINGTIGLSSSSHQSIFDMHDHIQIYVQKIFVNEKVFALAIFELESIKFK
ncbi:hypothetical protein N9Y17_03415, partial [Gammaproteobacteria bacterium]|nr:hypothetical protein [Gammaproteobacteria bacterium]